MAKHLKLITDKIEHTGAEGSPLLPTSITFEAKKKDEPIPSSIHADSGTGSP